MRTGREVEAARAGEVMGTAAGEASSFLALGLHPCPGFGVAGLRRKDKAETQGNCKKSQIGNLAVKAAARVWSVFSEGLGEGEASRLGAVVRANWTSAAGGREPLSQVWGANRLFARQPVNDAAFQGATCGGARLEAPGQALGLGRTGRLPPCQAHGGPVRSAGGRLWEEDSLGLPRAPHSPFLGRRPGEAAGPRAQPGLLRGPAPGAGSRGEPAARGGRGARGGRAPRVSSRSRRRAGHVMRPGGAGAEPAAAGRRAGGRPRRGAALGPERRPARLPGVGSCGRAVPAPGGRAGGPRLAGLEAAGPRPQVSALGGSAPASPRSPGGTVRLPPGVRARRAPLAGPGAARPAELERVPGGPGGEREGAPPAPRGRQQVHAAALPGAAAAAGRTEEAAAAASATRDGRVEAPSHRGALAGRRESLQN